jgi:glycosyltransferase involved in cell wall biosynthesis
MVVSVLLCVFNGADTVEAAVESIVSQTLRDWELIIVDDGSTDGTRTALARYTDPRIRVVYNDKNRGLPASLNIAFRHSSGELIARMDADDIALPDRLAKQARFLSEHPEIDVLGGAALLLGVDGLSTRRETHEEMASYAFTENPLIHPTVMLRRSFLEELGGYDETIRRAEDYDLWLRGIARFRYYNLQEPLIRYRPPTRATFRQARDAARAVWLHGRRSRKRSSGAYGAARFIAAFMLWKLAHLRADPESS